MTKKRGLKRKEFAESLTISFDTYISQFDDRPKTNATKLQQYFFSSICSKTLDYFLLSFSVEAFQAIAQNWSHPLLTDNAVISDLCDKERRYGGFTMFQKCQKHSQIMYHFGGFQLLDLIIPELKSRVIPYKFKSSHWLKLQHSDWRANLVKDFFYK